MFVDFEDTETGKRVAVNSDYVVAVLVGDKEAVSVLVDKDKAHRVVKGEYLQVVAKLNGRTVATAGALPPPEVTIIPGE